MASVWSSKISSLTPSSGVSLMKYKRFTACSAVCRNGSKLVVRMTREKGGIGFEQTALARLSRLDSQQTGQQKMSRVEPRFIQLHECALELARLRGRAYRLAITRRKCRPVSFSIVLRQTGCSIELEIQSATFITVDEIFPKGASDCRAFTWNLSLALEILFLVATLHP